MNTAMKVIEIMVKCNCGAWQQTHFFDGDTREYLGCGCGRMSVVKRPDIRIIEEEEDGVDEGG